MKTAATAAGLLDDTRRALMAFGEPGMAERIVDAWSRGTKVTIDLVTEWDYWRDMDRPLDAVRSRYDVLLK